MDYLLPAHIHYGKKPIKLFFPENWDVTIARMKGADTPALGEDALVRQIENPIEKDTIEKDAKGKKSAVIIFEDTTRPSSLEPVAKHVLEQLRLAGIPKQNIRFIAAVGMHRAMILPDFVRKLGKDIPVEYPVFTHNPFYGCKAIGTTSLGTPVEINSDVLEAEYKITLGSYVPHGFAGFGGSYKLILPGVSSFETIKANHTKNHLNEERGPGKRKGNVIINDMMETAMQVGVDFSIGCILNEKAEICHIFAGDITAAYNQGCLIAEEHYKTDVVRDVDVALLNNFMKATEPNNALNANAIAGVRAGGDIILASNSPEGTCTHYLYGNFGLAENNTAYLYSAGKRRIDHINRSIAFSMYPDMGASWWFGKPEEVIWADEWEKVLGILGKEKKHIAVYPCAEVQIIE